MSTKSPRCRFDGKPLEHTFVDLGMSPLANSYLKLNQLRKAEKLYPLHAYVCPNEFLVQLEEFESPQQIFGDYAYFSSYSESWLQHAKKYVDEVVKRFRLNSQSQVIEIASNDGYLLQYFGNYQVPTLGIEPAENVAVAAEERGIPTLKKFFGVQTARELLTQQISADLLIGNNVLAHVPSLNDFVAGMKIVLKPSGVFTMEFPHLLQLIQQNEFDTIYHEHFSYFSFLTVERIFAAHALTLFDVEELPTHGGSLRIFGKHSEAVLPEVTNRVAALKQKEVNAGLNRLETYTSFAARVQRTKQGVLEFLSRAKADRKSVVAYGAPAKGNTLLNYCGVSRNLIDYTVDISPHKQGLFLPGTHIPILPPAAIKDTRPDYVLILPWNLKEEIMSQMNHIRSWGGKFVTPIPEVRVYQ